MLSQLSQQPTPHFIRSMLHNASYTCPHKASDTCPTMHQTYAPRCISHMSHNASPTTTPDPPSPSTPWWYIETKTHSQFISVEYTTRLLHNKIPCSRLPLLFILCDKQIHKSTHLLSLYINSICPNGSFMVVRCLGSRNKISYPETERCKPVLDLCCSFPLLLAACQGPLKLSALRCLRPFQLWQYGNYQGLVVSKRIKNREHRIS